MKLLGEPNIEFPREGTLVQWRAGSEVILSNGYVIAVEMLPIETEEERLERELSIQEDQKRLEAAYQAVANHERISYEAWLTREAIRLEEDQSKLKSIQSYKARRIAQRKAAIRAEALRRSRRRCGY
jgi:predicted trehalose synthase